MATKAPASGPTAPLPKDPQPSVDRIEELARRILTGDILLPKFQRNFVWDKKQILILLDSISKGFPIGSVLLWQSRQELRSENRIADLDIELPRPDYPVNYLLDGQQRLSAICGALFWSGGNPASRWNIAYDLRAKKFLHLESMDDPPLHLVRVNKLSDPSAYFKHVAGLETLTAGDKDELKHAAEALFARFKDYKIAAVTLADMSIKDVAPIFERINSTGTTLTIVDLMRAATWSPEFDLVDSIDAILAALSEKSFSEIDRKVVLRSISAATGGEFTAESIDTLRNHDAATLKMAVTAAGEAYKRAVDFLVTHIGVPNGNIIPYSNQMTVLAEIFRMIPTPNAAQLAAVTRWFWATSVSGHFGGWNTGMMSEDRNAVRRFAAGEVNEIAVSTALPDEGVWVNTAFRANYAHAKLLAIVLAHHRPRDLLTGAVLDVDKALAWANAKEYHHFFPDAYLKGKGVAPRKVNALANFIMLSSASNKHITNRAPSDYLREVEAAAGPNLKDWLNSNLIPVDAFMAAKGDDYDGFLKLRARHIHQTVLKLASP
ncbi:MAG TPA: DUF262 domain-containing protein [Lacunisphaera sp.]|nr:DUF262 domain-containing protein [Lacunisphaera sp.]